ncbi:MAG: hypothetical protein ACRC0V_01630 [Fusobacteriaceae bacterium]
MNFVTAVLEGQKGQNKGLPMGDALSSFSKHIGGLQRSRIYGVAASPKVGKTTFVDFGFVIQPYLYAVENNIDVEWIYYSFEMDRISKEFDFATYFLYNDFNILSIKLEKGITYDGSNTIELCSDYLRGRLLDDNEKLIKINEDIFEKLKEIYSKRIIPLFGQYDSEGNKIKKGKLILIEHKDNPTGIYKNLKEKAEKEGKIEYDKDNSSRIISFTPNNPEKYTIVVIDHLRKLIPERGWQMKQVVDKMLDYEVELRNNFLFTFVNVIHTNRNVASVDKMKFLGEELYPTSEDVKDSGNVSEDADYVITLFNPNDSKYGLKTHFGLKLKDSSNNQLYPYLRTIHLVESRHSYCPAHFIVNMKANIKSFKKIKIK